MPREESRSGGLYAPLLGNAFQLSLLCPSSADRILSAAAGWMMRDFNDPGQYGQLKEKVVINATGYAARDLWRDKTVFPVRGQTGWLVPQHEALIRCAIKTPR
jgi:hypothetical protein